MISHEVSSSLQTNISRVLRMIQHSILPEPLLPDYGQIRNVEELESKLTRQQFGGESFGLRLEEEVSH